MNNSIEAMTKGITGLWILLLAFSTCSCILGNSFNLSSDTIRAPHKVKKIYVSKLKGTELSHQSRVPINFEICWTILGKVRTEGASTSIFHLNKHDQEVEWRLHSINRDVCADTTLDGRIIYDVFPTHIEKNTWYRVTFYPDNRNIEYFALLDSNLTSKTVQRQEAW